MVITGVELDSKIRAAKKALKGQRGGKHEPQAVRALANLQALRCTYLVSVHARFHLDHLVQVSLAVAIAYAKNLRYTHPKLAEEIRQARRVKLTLEDDHAQGATSQ